MKKFVCCFFILVIILSLFTGCNSSSDDVITSDDGIDYIVVRDDEDSIVINENDKLQVYVVNENGKKQKNDNGEYITKFIDFNGQVVIGNVIETAELRFELPKGFVADSDNPGYFYNESYEAEIFFAYYGSDYDIAVSAAEGNCESLLESYGSEVFEYKKYKIDVDSAECFAFKQRCTSSEYYKNAYAYYIPYDNGFYLINCNVSTEYENRFNFDKFIDSIEIK